LGWGGPIAAPHSAQNFPGGTRAPHCVQMARLPLAPDGSADGTVPPPGDAADGTIPAGAADGTLPTTGDTQ
jgi:hypothetical protein